MRAWFALLFANVVLATIPPEDVWGHEEEDLFTEFADVVDVSRTLPDAGSTPTPTPTPNPTPNPTPSPTPSPTAIPTPIPTLPPTPSPPTPAPNDVRENEVFVSFELEWSRPEPSASVPTPAPKPHEEDAVAHWNTHEKRSDLKNAVARTINYVVDANVCPDRGGNVRKLEVTAPVAPRRNLRVLLGMDNRTVLVAAYAELEAAGEVTVGEAKEKVRDSVVYSNASNAFHDKLLEHIKGTVDNPEEKKLIKIGPVQAVTDGTGTVPTPADGGGSNGVALALGLTAAAVLLYLCYCYRSRKTTIRKERTRVQNDREKQIELERFGRIAGVRNFEGHSSSGPSVPQSSLGRMEGIGSTGPGKQKKWKKSNSGSMGSFGR